MATQEAADPQQRRLEVGILLREMAGDPAAVLALMGLGVNSLSMSASNLPRVKWVIRSFTREEARNLLEQAWQLESPREVRELYNSVLEQGGLGGLVRAGN